VTAAWLVRAASVMSDQKRDRAHRAALSNSDPSMQLLPGNPASTLGRGIRTCFDRVNPSAQTMKSILGNSICWSKQRWQDSGNLLPCIDNGQGDDVETGRASKRSPSFGNVKTRSPLKGFSVFENAFFRRTVNSTLRLTWFKLAFHLRNDTRSWSPSGT